MKPKKILVTTDFSDDSKRAFDLASLGLATEGVEVLLVHVFDEYILPPTVLVNMPRYEEMLAQAKDAAKEHLEECKGLFAEGVTVETKLVSKVGPDVGKEITDLASSESADVIVISSHGRGSLGTLLLGSVAQKVTAQATCPILIVPKNFGA